MYGEEKEGSKAKGGSEEEESSSEEEKDGKAPPLIWKNPLESSGFFDCGCDTITIMGVKGVLPLSLLMVGILIIAGFSVANIPGGRINNSASIIVAVNSNAAASSSVADVVSSSTLTGVLLELQNQTRALAEGLNDVRSEIRTISLRDSLNTSYVMGDTGDEVSALQEVLGLYSGQMSSSSITGYYGSATAAIVRQFQSENNLPQTGLVDLATRNKLIDFAGGLSADASSSVLIAMTNLSSVGELQDVSNLKNAKTQDSIGDLQNQVTQLTADLSNTQGQLTDLQNQVAALAASAAPLHTTTLPIPSAVTAVLSSVLAKNITNNSATITWNTNAPASSQVAFGLTGSYGFFTALNTAAVTTHSVVLTGLRAATLYHFRAMSSVSGSSFTSSTDQTFKTLQ